MTNRAGIYEHDSIGNGIKVPRKGQEISIKGSYKADFCKWAANWLDQAIVPF